ncbi:MAG: hypothetical protein SVR08_01810 [Spirochaetota bacterium]|nr:hypothetical protein [Spirochaetota bacterium]
MNKQLYDKIKSMFHLIEHNYEKCLPSELVVLQLSRGNVFDMRVQGLDEIIKFRDENPDCSITFKPNHLSEADFILLYILFAENDMRVLIEGGSNLFIDNIDLYQDIIPNFINHGIKEIFKDQKMYINEYMLKKGGFKVFREPTVIAQDDGSEIHLGKKEIISLSRAYRYHLVKNKEMYVTFPGYSSSTSELLQSKIIKTGRSYSGKTDGFHHLPFLMDIEASLLTGVDVYIVDVNIAYEPVLEDEYFKDIKKLHESGANRDEIYYNDLGFIIKEFIRNRKTGDLSIKFGKPLKIDTSLFKDHNTKIKIKKAAATLAEDTFNKSLFMHPIFPSNIYFTAFNKDFDNISIRNLKDNINEIRDYLINIAFGGEKTEVDLHYILGYNDHIISADEIINRTFQKFSIPEKKITGCEGDMFVVYNKDAAIQYRNHSAHILESMNDKEYLKRLAHSDR